MADQMINVQGYCPMGCGPTLFVGDGGFLTCSYVECPRPDASSDILLEPETEHVVTLREREFTVKHPLKERLDDALLDCMLHAEIRQWPGPPRRPGRYRVSPIDADPVSETGRLWHWEPLDG